MRIHHLSKLDLFEYSNTQASNSLLELFIRGDVVAVDGVPSERDNQHTPIMGEANI